MVALFVNVVRWYETPEILLFSALVRIWGCFNLMNFKRCLYLINIEFSKLGIAVLHGLLVNLNFLFENF